MKTVLAFDMDDTLVDTRMEVFKLAYRYCLSKKLDVFCHELKDKFQKEIPVNLLSKELRSLIDKEVIAKREYLRSASRSSFCDISLENLLIDLRNGGGEIKIVICTHRGNNKEAFMSTYSWLEDEGILEYFDMIHTIDNKVHKDKIQFLKGTYPDHKVILVDDDPHTEDKESVLIFDKINKHKKYEGFVTCSRPADILPWLK